MLTLLVLPLLPAPADKLLVDRDNLVITQSCTVEIGPAFIEDADDNGVLQIQGNNLVVDFEGRALRGAAPGRTSDAYAGIGVRITGNRVVLKNAVLSGFRGAIWASGANGLEIAGCDLSDNRRHRLRSTEAAEDQGDWLWPHENDQNQWLSNYGAGIYVEDSRSVKIHDNRARAGQNGCLLDRVSDSQVYDNDFSFLSGWGLGLFRCERNQISRNSLDFCVRGYSHGVYARGQDSAGILCFEQNKDNVFAFNSATHSGDGFFGFAGNEALERVLDRPKAGNSGNLLYGNDFSYAPAIGIEMTFSCDNTFAKNRLVGSNYGIWGGYSSGTLVFDNQIAENTIAGIAIEHGSSWDIVWNSFSKNRRGLQLWWDEDRELAAKPWAKLNPTASRNFAVFQNTFEGDEIGVELRQTTEVKYLNNLFNAVPRRFDYDDASSGEEVWIDDLRRPDLSARVDRLPGKREAVGGRKELAGRDKIVMTEWGPYDWQAPYLRRLVDQPWAHVWSPLGKVPFKSASASGAVAMEIRESHPVQIVVRAKEPGTAPRYALEVEFADGTILERSATLVAATWKVRFFAWKSDPRQVEAQWRAESAAAHGTTLPSLDLAFQNGGPSELSTADDALKAAQLPADRFGTLAETELLLSKGRWRVTTTSDDGVRVLVDGKRVIDHWDWHAPEVDTAEIESDGLRKTKLEVEHFELDGFAQLRLELEPIP